MKAIIPRLQAFIEKARDETNDHAHWEEAKSLLALLTSPAVSDPHSLAVGDAIMWKSAIGLPRYGKIIGFRGATLATVAPDRGSPIYVSTSKLTKVA